MTMESADPPTTAESGVDTVAPAMPPPRIAKINLEDIFTAFQKGIRDFRSAPAPGLILSAVYVALGAGLLALGAGTFVWTLALALGYPIVAPFAAVGLYDVSRRLELGEPFKLHEVFSVVQAERHRQMPWLGLVLMLIFLFWSFFAHMSVALFLGPSALIDLSHVAGLLASERGIALVVFQLVVGAAVAFLTFTLTVVSLPLLLDKDVDVVTAMRVSVRTVSKNLGTMLVWAAMIAGLLFLAMLPYFLGLFLVLPVLGHATWHLYRRVLYHPRPDEL